jgi:hypothetical protein
MGESRRELSVVWASANVIDSSRITTYTPE